MTAEYEDDFSQENEISKPTAQEIENLCQMEPLKVLEALEMASHKGHHDVIHLFMKDVNFKKFPIHQKIIDKEVLVDDNEEKPYYNIIKLLLLLEEEMEQHHHGKQEEIQLKQPVEEDTDNSICNSKVQGGSPDLLDSTINQNTSTTGDKHSTSPVQAQESESSKVTTSKSTDKSRKPQRPKSSNPHTTKKTLQKTTTPSNTATASPTIPRTSDTQDKPVTPEQSKQKRVQSASATRSPQKPIDSGSIIPKVVVVAEQNPVDPEKVKAPLTRPQTAVGGPRTTPSALKKPIVQSPRTQKVAIEEKSNHKEEVVSPKKNIAIHIRKTSPRKDKAVNRNAQRLSQEEINQWKRVDAFLTRERPRNSALFSNGQDCVEVDLLRLFAATNPDVLRDYISASLDSLKPASAIDHSQREQRAPNARNALLLVIDLILALKYRIVSFVDLILPALISCVCDHDKGFVHEIAHQALDLLVAHCVTKRLVLEMIECSFLETPSEDEDEKSRMINHLGYYMEKLISKFSDEALKKLVIGCEKALFLPSVGHMILHAKASGGKTCLEECIEQVFERVFHGQEEKFMEVVKLQINHVASIEAQSDIEGILIKIIHHALRVSESKKQNGLQRPQTANAAGSKKATTPSLFDRLLPLYQSHIKK